MNLTEDEIRRQTGWKAFREGQALARNGAVSDFKQREGILTGSFKQGRRTLRTVVRLEGGLSAECGCAANHATGEICCHAVTLMLAAIERQTVGPPDADESTSEPAGELLSCEVTFPDSLEKMLAKGRLSASLSKVDEEPNAADAALSLWLACHAAGRGYPKLINLGGEELDGFLEALAGHSRLRCGTRDVRITAERLAPLQLKTSESKGKRLHLKLGDAARPIRWGKTIGRLTIENELMLIGRLPVEPPSLAWRDEVHELMESGCLEISLDDFLAAADSWLDLFQSPLPGWLGALRFEPAEVTIHLTLEGSLNALDASASVSESGNDAFPLSTGGMGRATKPHIDEGNRLRTRNTKAEAKALQLLTRAGFESGGREGGFRLRDPDAVVAFLADELPQLRERWQISVGERLQHVLQSLHVVRPKFDSPQSLAWELSFETDAGKGIPEAKIREILRTGRRSVKTSKGATVAISREIPELIEPLLADLGIPTREGQIQLDRARDLILQNFRKKDLNTWETNEEKWPKLPALSTELRAYQKDGAVWLIERLQQLSGALLADEMGLGKTVQTLTAVRFFRTERSAPCLVLVPTSLLANWQAEFERWTPDLRVLCLHGPGRDEKRDELGKSDVVLTSYGTLCRDLAFHLKQDYGLLVADEASLLRNPDSETSRAVAKLKAGKRLALTGTPVENRLRDLWAIFRLIAPGYLGARKEFEERYEALDDSADRRRLRLRIAPFVLRRTKAEVAKDLPEKAIIDEWIQLDAESRQTYASLARAGLRKLESMEDQPRQARMHLLTLLLRLRQLCLDPRLVDEQAEAGAKTRRLHELLTERAESGAKTLVFSQFRKYLGLASRDLDGSCGRIFQLDGSTRNRGDLIREFQEHDGPAVFMISLKAGGYGLNLTAADAVIHMDPWWNPAVEAQASDRAHRIGQTQPVTVYRLLAKDSVEERVRRLQQAKQSVISSFNDGSAPNNWSETDLRGLVEGA